MQVLFQLCSFSTCIFDLECVMVESTVMKPYKYIWVDK